MTRQMARQTPTRRSDVVPVLGVHLGVLALPTWSESRLLETLLGQLHIAIIVNNAPQQSIFGGVLQYELKFNFL
jgi:hypothetical protein